MSWNVQGLHTKLKQHDFVQYCNSFDIFACSEIHNCCKETMETTFYKYNVYISKRKEFKGGGVAVFVSKLLNNYISKIDIHLDECIALYMKKSYLNTDKNIIYCFPYIAHEYSTVFQGQTIKGMERLIELYDSLFIKYGDTPWVVGGDLNARTGSLLDFNYI